MNKIFNLFILTVIFFFNISSLSCQILITNRSFEGQIADATMPSGWFSQSEGTTPDILPGYWGVYLEPEDGDSYVGLITRGDGSFESIGQRLSHPLSNEHCYQFSIDLSFSDNYSGYNNPLFLKIWISNKRGHRQQLIYKSPKIDHLEWKTYNVEFIPAEISQYIIIEAFISDERIPYKGNILLDNMSHISNCNRA